MLQVVFSEAAENDLMESSAWYEMNQEGLSKRFLKEVFSTTSRIEIDPLIYQSRYIKIYRAAKVHKFPYLVLYTPFQRRKF